MKTITLKTKINPRHHKKRTIGFSIIELVIASFVLAVGLLALVSLYSSFYTLSVKSRNRVYAEIIAKSTMERIREHDYGEPEPPSWNENVTLRFFSEVDASSAVKGGSGPGANLAVFKKKVEYQNGSFVGKTDDNYDAVTVTLTWEEAAPQKVRPNPLDKKVEGYTQIKFTTEVRRTIPDQAPIK